MIRTATLSPCGLYRYDLRRVWGDPDSANLLAICGANPSKADAQREDPTSRRCIGFAKREGCDGLVIGNVRTYRATDPNDVPALTVHEMGVNAAALHALCDEFPVIVCAWGTVADPVAVHQALQIFEKAGTVLVCFGITKDGHPKHPVRLPNSAPLVPFARRAA